MRRAVIGRVDRYQRRHRWLGFPIAVVYKFVDDFGVYLAALIAYYAFVSIFPLLLLSATILGFVLAKDPGLQQQILNSALSQFPVIGTQLYDPKHLGGGPAGLTVGIIGSLYGGLGAAQALQYAMNTAWSVPRNRRPNPFKARGRSLLLLGTGGLGILAITALSAISAGNAGSFGSAVRVLVFVAQVLANTAIFGLAFRIATSEDVSWRDVLPGATLASVAWQVMQTIGVAYIGGLRNSSATNGVFALVLGLLGFLFIAAIVVVFCAEINVVRSARLYPRALLTPFTDNVSLTKGDVRAYTRQAQAQAAKGFQDIDVDFEGEDGSSDYR